MTGSLGGLASIRRLRERSGSLLRTGTCAADVGARLALDPVQIPVGIVTGLLGGPHFLYLMRRKQQLGDF